MINYKKSGIIISIVVLILCTVIAVISLTTEDNSVDINNDNIVNEHTEKQSNEEALQAYGNVLKDFCNNFKFPDGTYEEVMDEENYNMSDNRFAIADIDMDGENELILSLTHYPMAAMRAIIYEYDSPSRTIKEKFTGFTSMAFYDNGVITVDWSHSQGYAGDALWPYTIYKYDKTKDTYMLVAGVDAWDKSFTSGSDVNNEFPQEIDKDEDGIIYYIIPEENNKAKYAVDFKEYNDWRNQYINENTKKIEIDYIPLTKENIDVAINNYEYINVPDDSKINEIIIEGEKEEVSYVGVNSNFGYTIQYDKEVFELYRQDGKDYYRSRLDAIKDKVYFTIEHLEKNYYTLKEENIGSKENMINGKKSFCLTYIDNILINENAPMNLPNISSDSDVKEVYYIDADNGTFLVEVHYFYEASEGFGVRIAQMVNSFEVKLNEPKTWLDIIMNNKNLWYREEYSDAYGYAITDLNQNGRIEIISSSLQGTGLYTYSKIYEVNEAQNGLNAYKSNLHEYSSAGDLFMSKELDTYIDKENNVYNYIFNDYVRNGAAENYESIVALHLTSDKIVHEELLAMKSTIYEQSAIYDGSSIPNVTYNDANQNSITEAEYENIADEMFNNLEKKRTYIGWVLSNEKDLENMKDEELKILLSNSYTEFKIK